MIHPEKYLNALKQQLSENPKLRKCFSVYIGDAREADASSVREMLQSYQAALKKQLLLDERLDPAYEQSFRDLAHLAMRLAYLAELEDAPDSKEEELRRRLTVRLLTGLCSAPDWALQGKNGKLFSADLWTGSLCVQTAILYTLLKKHCTQDEREAIRSGILKNGIEAVLAEWLDPETHRHALDSMGHNWWLVIVCGAGVAALALQEELPCCREYLRRILDGIRLWFRYPGNVLQNKKANFGPDGDYIEYLGYMTYGFSTYCMLESFYRDETGSTDLFEETYLRPQLTYYLANFYWADGHLRMPGFGDSPERLVKHQHVIYYLTERFGCGRLFEMQSLMSDGPNEYEDFLFYPLAAGVTALGEAPEPLFCVQPHAGYATARTGYGKEDRFFSIKTGESWNHNHLDVGTFLLTDGGMEIAVDSGCCNYGRPEYREYYTAPKAHNVVLFNGQGQDSDMIDSGTKFSGCFPSWVNPQGQDYLYLLADCTGPYTGIYTRFYRHILLLRDWTVLIDDIQTLYPGTLSWQMHYAGQPGQEDGCLKWLRGNQEICLYPVYPPHQTLQIEKGLRDGEMLSSLGLRDPMRHTLQMGQLPEGSFVSLQSRISKRRAKLIQVISRPHPKGKTAPPALVETDGGILVTLSSGGRQEQILVNTHADGSYMHQNSWLNSGSWETDAFLVYAAFDAANDLTKVGIVNGSRLRMGNDFSLGCLMKLDAFFDLPGQSGCVRSGLEQELLLKRHGQPFHPQLKVIKP